MDEYSLEALRSQEAARRLAMLGHLANQNYEYKAFRKHARLVLIPIHVLRTWEARYKAHGLNGLTPDYWVDLDAPSLSLARERYEHLGPLADALTVSREAIEARAARLGWEPERLSRWLARYRSGGFYALAPGRNIEKPKHDDRPRRPLAALDPAGLAEVDRRRRILGDLAANEKVTEAAVQQRAAEHNISAKTFWNWLRRYREDGLQGLVPQQRADRNHRHNLSERMERVIIGLRLSKRDRTVRNIYEEVCMLAPQLGEPTPSKWQVRSVVESIPDPVTLLADGRSDEFRNKLRITYRMRFTGTPVVYMLDHTTVDVLVKDLRKEGVRTTSGQIRPRLSLMMAAGGRLVVAARFSYDQPNAHTTAGTIADGLLKTEEHPYRGIPDEIWIDNGKDLTARHVEYFTRELGIALHRLEPHQPQQKGIIERFFGTLNTRLWSTLPGYVNSNTVERNPEATAVLTIAQLEHIFWTFVNQYHQEVHSETGQSPLAFTLENSFTESAAPGELEMLLKQARTRTVLKIGIKHEQRVYWHTTLARFVGQEVTVLNEPDDVAPDEIDVLDADGQLICRAFATDSDRGRAVTPEEIASAQRAQRAAARTAIEKARAALKDVQRGIGTRASTQAEENTTTKEPREESPPEPDRQPSWASDDDDDLLLSLGIPR